MRHGSAGGRKVTLNAAAFGFRPQTRLVQFDQRVWGAFRGRPLSPCGKYNHSVSGGALDPLGFRRASDAVRKNFGGRGMSARQRLVYFPPAKNPEVSPVLADCTTGTAGSPSRDHRCGCLGVRRSVPRILIMARERRTLRLGSGTVTRSSERLRDDGFPCSNDKLNQVSSLFRKL